jgi:sterol desaturase/sphingolipid hydroxylase (fatty acid hydroxylase superfamily)
MLLLVTWLRRHGHGLSYATIAERGWAYWGFSIVLMMLLHDAYFYFTHRLMHHPLLFKRFHLVHHLSTNPSPWAAYAFHPLETIVEAGITVLIAFTIPYHPSALVTFILISLLFNIEGHLGYEFWPKGMTRNKWLNWNNTSTHHNMHHQTFRYNYGLYFNWWDKLFGTNHPEYHDRFDAITSRTPQNAETVRPSMHHGLTAASH